MKLKKTLLALAITAVSSTAALADIKIGVSLSLTGPGSGLGIPMQKQLQLFPKTIGGEKVQLIILDDATDPGKGAANARRFVTEDKVDLIFGSCITAVAAAMTDIAAEAGTVQIAGSPVGVPPGKDKWLFRLPQSNTVMGHAVVEHMKKQGVKTVGFLGYTDAYGQQWLDAVGPMLDKAGIKLVGTERFARTDTSVTPQALKLTSANPDAMLVVASGSGAAMPQMGLVERGYKGKVYQTHGVANNDFLRVCGKDCEGTFLPAGPVLVSEQLPNDHPVKKSAIAYVNAYEKAHGKGSVSTFGAHAWDAGVLLQAAIPVALKKAQPGTKEFRAALRDALEGTTNLPAAHGVFNMSAKDHLGLDQRARVMVSVRPCGSSFCTSWVRSSTKLKRPGP